MNILVVNWMDREHPLGGGAEIHLHEVFGRLAARGHRVAVLASGWPGLPARAELDGMEIHRTGGRYTFSVAAPRYYRRELRHRAWDVVVEDLNKVPLFTPLWAHRPVTLLVHHLFGEVAFREASLPMATATWLLERFVGRLYHDRPTVAISRSTARDLERRGIPAERMEVIPNGVDLEGLTPDPEGRRFAEPTLLYLGRLKRYKRVDLPIRAVSELGRRGRGVRLLVAGRGDDGPRLQRLVERLGLEDRVQFLGFVDEARKLELLQRSWAHVLTSPKEGWGIANLEAAACGTPTVASDAPGLRDSVVHGRTGLLVPHGDVGALARALDAFLTDTGTRDEMGRAARRFAEEFTWEAAADGMERFLGDRVAIGRSAV